MAHILRTQQACGLPAVKVFRLFGSVLIAILHSGVLCAYVTAGSVIRTIIYGLLCHTNPEPACAYVH
jgi:polyferredoxin